MKKGINKSILFYIASVLFFIVSAIGFTSGNESSMAIVWLCLGSSCLCFGSTHKKKENNTDDRSEHLLFRAVLLMNSGVTDTETIRPESREELILCRI